jgi:alginate O-acetyltransferase complex protein AlgI
MEGVGHPAIPITHGIIPFGIIAFAFQIYFDFSGYSDMAIGLGSMFGFHFLENFKHPFIAKSASEFWRRWHITLGAWFRDYVYFPLGGCRVS